MAIKIDICLCYLYNTECCSIFGNIEIFSMESDGYRAELEKILSENDYEYQNDIDDLVLMHKIYNLYKNHVMFNPENGVEYKYLGLYYNIFFKDYDKMMECYNMAIEKGNYCVMFNMGLYYEKVQKNYDLMKKYYLMAVEKSDTRAMYNLGLYYENIEKNNNLSKKYYEMGANNGCASSMNNLAIYYEDIGNRYLAEKYYSMSIEKRCIEAMYNLAIYYRESGYTDLAVKYYLMACENKCKSSFEALVQYYCDNIKDINPDEMFLKFINLGHFQDELPPFFKLVKRIYGEKIDLINLHFNYTENGLGYEEAKKDFNNKLLSLSKNH